MSPGTPLTTSHLIVHVADTETTIDFWCSRLGGELESDEILADPALDAMFGRRGVRIRNTFLRIGGLRLHTIEALDVPRQSPAADAGAPAPGIGGVSFLVPDIERARENALSEGLEPTEIYEFSDLPEPVRMFFLEDPNRIRVELMASQRPER